VSEAVRVKIRPVACVLAACAVVVLAACGSSTSTAKPAAGSQTTSTTTPTSPPVVMTATNATLGTVLVDSSGMTLYTLTNAGAPVACTGQCLTFWPPLLLSAGTTTASGAAGVTGLGTVAAAGGTQVTANGAPLYHFAADAAPGDAKGEGKSSFGGTWHVVTASAAPSATTTPNSAATATTTPNSAATAPTTPNSAATAPTTPNSAATAPTTSSGGGYSYP
jgi:predicted lipoprotein with Yx(FWY)xxD motif